MINLLPPSEKKEIETDRRATLWLIFESALGLFLLSFCLALWASQSFLEGEIGYQKTLLAEKQKEISSDQVRKLFRQAGDWNKELNQVENFFQSQVKIGPILEKINQALPPGSYLTGFSVSGESPAPPLKISLAGFCPKREQLLDFRKKLEEDPRFGKVDFPASNWVSPSDIDFSVTLEIAP